MTSAASASAPSEFRNPQLNVAFDRIVRQVEQWLASRPLAVPGVDPATVRARLVQRFVELGLTPFARHCIACIARGEHPVVSGPISMDLGGIQTNLETGALRPTRRLRGAATKEFCKHWLYVLVNVALGDRGGRGSDDRPLTVVLGVGGESLFLDGSDARFVNFCRSGPVRPLVQAHRVLVEAPSGSVSTQPRDFVYHSVALVEAARSFPIGGAARSRFLARHLRALGSFFASIARNSPVVTLARDLAYFPLAQMLDEEGALDAIIITTSNYASQPLWMRPRPGRRLRVHMVWYAQGVIPFVYRSDGLVSDWPNYRHLFADESWVWTQEFADYLRKLGTSGEVHAVGPILFHLPEEYPSRSRGDAIRLVVFDVTAVRASVARELGVVSHYYTSEVMTRFVGDIVHAASDLRSATGAHLHIALKQKRSFTDIHDPEYLRFLRELERDGEIEILSSQVNLFSLVAAADAAIVIPFSSPAYVTAHMGTPAIFYDPTGQLLPTFFPARGLGFAASRAELASALRRVVERSAH